MPVGKMWHGLRACSFHGGADTRPVGISVGLACGGRGVARSYPALKWGMREGSLGKGGGWQVSAQLLVEVLALQAVMGATWLAALPLFWPHGLW